jgi:type VI secretion system protein ImpH
MLTIVEQLLATPQNYNLFQAISILERANPSLKPIATSLGTDEAVRFAAQVDLAFSPSDISHLDPSTSPGPPMTLFTGVLSLAGAMGPLPAPFVELLLDKRRTKDRPGLDFLDIFNQRLIGFFYRNRRKHSLALSPNHLDSAPLVKALEAVSGLGRSEGALAPEGQSGWLRHASVQGAAPRSISSLLCILRDRFKTHFTCTQFKGGWQSIVDTERARLSSNPGPEKLQISSKKTGGSKLGFDVVLGDKAWDQGAGIALFTPALSVGQFKSFLPGASNNLLLGWLVGWHLQRELQITLEIDLDSAPTSLLGHGYPVQSRLGYSAWLCNAAQTPGLKSKGYPHKHQKPRFRLFPKAKDHQRSKSDD